MEKLFHDRLFDFYESLAYHFTEGLSIEKAVDYLVKSGAKSHRRWALEESNQYYKTALGLLTSKQDKTEEEEKKWWISLLSGDMSITAVVHIRSRKNYLNLISNLQNRSMIKKDSECFTLGLDGH